MIINCDDAEAEKYLVAQHINLHSILTVINQIAFVGVGGSLPYLERTLTEYSEEQLQSFLKKAVQQYSSTMPMILVSHQPPRADNSRCGL